MDRLAQLLITMSRLDTRLPPLVRLVLILKFVGLLILVSIGLMMGFVEISLWKEVINDVSEI